MFIIPTDKPSFYAKFLRAGQPNWKQINLSTTPARADRVLMGLSILCACFAHCDRVRNSKEHSAPGDEPKGTALYLFSGVCSAFEF